METTTKKEEFTFFWKDKSPFSQWNHNGFEIDGIRFPTAEYYMMYMKADLFGDEDVKKQVLEAKHSRDVKALGRKVNGFDKDLWEDNCKKFVYDANVAKFTQNKECYDALMETEGTELCEASPYDSIWGCGLNEEEARKIPKSEWPGTNWLGEILTRVREDIISGKITV